MTSDYILDEVITSLFKKVNFDGAQKFVEALLLDTRAGQIRLERIDDDRFNYAWLLRSIYRDKPDISFTDLTSGELKISEEKRKNRPTLKLEKSTCINERVSIITVIRKAGD